MRIRLAWVPFRQKDHCRIEFLRRVRPSINPHRCNRARLSARAKCAGIAQLRTLAYYTTRNNQEAHAKSHFQNFENVSIFIKVSKTLFLHIHLYQIFIIILILYKLSVNKAVQQKTSMWTRMTSNVNAYISFRHVPPCFCVLECDYVAVSCRLLSSRCRFIFELRKMRFCLFPLLDLSWQKKILIVSERII